MTNFTVNDEDGGEVADAEIATGLLLSARQEPPEAAEPAVRHLHHPTPRRVAVGVAWWRQWGGRAGLGRDWHRVASHGCRLPSVVVVIAAVQRQVRRLCRRRRDHSAVE